MKKKPSIAILMGMGRHPEEDEDEDEPMREKPSSTMVGLAGELRAALKGDDDEELAHVLGASVLQAIKEQEAGDDEPDEEDEE